ncbi:MAG TPA: SDR family NAD(P)-dependent oxidoreductase [Gammaproteobacteria bacterium]|nr:SDR family NAD(P)-dependent oxidoreductase [Gammaproteobacteria bacterium]
MQKRLTHKVAIITGASKGIGKGIAKIFAEHGAKLIITGRNKTDLEKVAHEIGGDIIPVVANMTSNEDMQKVAQLALAKFGRIDILCQNAGIYPTKLLRDMSESDWDETCDTNLKGSFLIIKACLPIMEKQKYGRIVFTSSITGPKVTQPGFAHYAASKAGMNGLIKTAALEYAHLGITVNGIEPGNISTEGLDDRPPEIVKSLLSAIPMGRFGTAEDVAYAALFLASDEAKYITGETIVVDGGQILPESPFIDLV